MRDQADPRPRLRIGIDRRREDPGSLRLVLPLRRSAKLIVGSFLVCALIAAFSAMLAGIALDIATRGRAPDVVDATWIAVMSLMAALLLIPLGAALFVFLALLAGREVIIVHPGVLSRRVSVFGLSVGADYEASRIRTLGRCVPGHGSMDLWRGPHLGFDYGWRRVAFGCDIDAARAADMIGRIKAVLGAPQPGTAAPSATLPPTAPALTDASPARVDAGADTSSPWFLLLANAVPLLGVLLFDWSLAHVMILYWLESAIIGFFNVLKMFRIGGLSALGECAFFVFHFGMFMSVHFVFLVYLFLAGPGLGDVPPSIIMELARDLRLAVLALFVSHGWSWAVNFIGQREYEGRTVREQMLEPYGRIVLMHMTLIGGAVPVMFLGMPVGALVLLVAIKTVMDLHAHRRGHRKGRSAAGKLRRAAGP